METDTLFTEIQDMPGEIFDIDFDDRFAAEDFERRQAERDGWQTGTWDGRW
jgi:hypothetical protein